jgi:hypothetical protein
MNIKVGFFGMLTILFVGLKLTGHIDWSWLWVLSPLWLPFALVCGGLLAVSLAVTALALGCAFGAWLTDKLGY